MSAQNLSSRSVRRIAKATGLVLVAGWSHGGYTLGFVTSDHRHGWYDKKTGEWGWHDPEKFGLHYTFCETRWPGYRDAS